MDISGLLTRDLALFARMAMLDRFCHQVNGSQSRRRHAVQVQRTVQLQTFDCSDYPSPARIANWRLLALPQTADFESWVTATLPRKFMKSRRLIGYLEVWRQGSALFAHISRSDSGR